MPRVARQDTSPVGGSILTTSAPKSARIALICGPARNVEISSTRMPASAPLDSSAMLSSGSTQTPTIRRAPGRNERGDMTTTTPIVGGSTPETDIYDNHQY